MKKRLLIAIPFLYGAEHSRLAIESVVNNDLDLLLIDNGAANDVKAVINNYHSRPNVAIISNPENVFVNPAWNMAMDFFLEHKQYTHLIIMNSDLIMQDYWSHALQNFFSKEENKNLIPVAILSDNIHVRDIDDDQFNKLEGGIAGVFIVMDRRAVEIVNPIHESIRVWFGDNVIYDLLRGFGYTTGVLNNLRAMHYCNGSQNVQRVAGISEIIEADKIAWRDIVQPLLIEKIKIHSNL